ncbi:hypothetical protein CDD82_1301 [Ophiocordyceps australis]|uniref:Ran GTPase-activating protein 1 n=1 Tax=Ophiocordyceps australis TaxID=1399860 RepID=A0A2C5YIQ7_9HYPO|nr:hypothetical protein CDD82_1301 [Ophiocordyceps australis]
MADSNKIFSLEGKGLKLDTEQDAEAHIAHLWEADIEEVRLLGNTLGVGACKRLGEFLASKKNLKVVNLADIFTGRLLSEIPDALSALLTSILNFPKLNTINLNDNAFGLNTQAPLVAFLSSHVPLQHLYLNNNGLGPSAGALVADALSELHAKKEAARKDGMQVPDLETIICGRNRLENGSMAAWAKTLSLHNKIKEIKMIQNGIRQEGISLLLSEGLSHTAGLQVLDLQDNTFTVMGAKALATVAPSWTLLRELGIGDSLLSAGGAILLSQALSQGKNQKLEILRLQYNDITSTALEGFASAARDALPALKRIELNGNKFCEDDDSILALQVLLEKRKEESADQNDQDCWGVDDLSDLEDDSEDESDKEETEREERAEKLIKDAQEAQREPVAQATEKDIDQLAEELQETSI